MARAYGQWFRERDHTDPDNGLRVIVYVVDPGLVAMLQGGYIDLLEELEDTPIHIEVETIDTLGQADRQHQIVTADEKLSGFIEPQLVNRKPRISAHPRPRLQSKRHDELSKTVREFGLVSGSTLIVDYRNQL
jgi:hypothetical protein